jgi:outer membrane protein TolC
MKKVMCFMVTALLLGSGFAQRSLTIDQAYELAKANYPLIRQSNLTEVSRDYSITNVWKGYFPQVTISGQATYQSDITSIPISVKIPGLSIPTPDKDQYKAVADVSQLIYDGGQIATQSSIYQANAKLDVKKTEADLDRIKDRINQLFFGILLIDEQLKQNNLTENDIQASLGTLSAALHEGTTSAMNVDVLKAELIKNHQKRTELVYSRIAYIGMLSLFIGEKLDDRFNPVKPAENEYVLSSELNRLELQAFSLQQSVLNEQLSLSDVKVLPKASVFFQGGYGKPGLNMFKNDFSWFYTTGIKFSWSPSSFYTFGKEKELIELSKKAVDIQKDLFVLNINQNLVQIKNEIAKLKELIETDEALITLRTRIKNSMKSELDNGIISANDFVRELDAEDLAKQNLAAHQVQLLLAEYNYKITSGN